MTVTSLSAVRLARSSYPIVSKVAIPIASIPTRQIWIQLTTEAGATLTVLTAVLTNSRLFLGADHYIQDLLHRSPQGREKNVLTALRREIS